MIRTETVHVCDFCAKTQREVKKMIEGPKVDVLGRLYICNECVDLCVDIIEEERAGEDLEALRLDAARYRALRDVPTQHGHQIHTQISDQGLTGAAMGPVADAAVDLLIAKVKGESHGL